jgi:hypothetical protein
MGMMQMLMGGAGGMEAGYQAALLGGTVENLSSSAAHVVVNMDGTLSRVGSSTTVESYYFPTTTDIGLGHYVRITYVSGNPLQIGDYGYGQGGFYNQSNTAIYAGYAPSTSRSRNGTFTIDISTNGTEGGIVCTGTYTFVN